jgi:hypothetical protein
MKDAQQEIIDELRMEIASLNKGNETLHKLMDEQLEEITILKAEIEMPKRPRLSRNQPCGCVVCYCEGPQCGGCGAKNCGHHAPGEMPNPVFDAPMVRLDDPVVTGLVEAFRNFEQTCYLRDNYLQAHKALSAYEARVKEVGK